MVTAHQRPGHLLLTLRTGEARAHVPAHADVLVGAGRPAGSLDGGPLDRALGGRNGFRARSVFHAQRSMGRVGEQASRFDDLEERLGLSRTYSLELADPDDADRMIDGLRELDLVESVSRQTLAVTPAVALADRPAPTAEQAEAPHRQVRAPEALAKEPGDERVTVAVVDTGVSLGHAEMQRKYLAGYDCVELGMGRLNETTTLVGDSLGRDFSPSDDVGHGSHVAGIIGAQGWQVPPGVGGRSLLLPIRVLAAARMGGGAVTGVGALSDIDAGLKVAVDLGARVLNMSFGTPAGAVDPAGDAPHSRSIAYALHHGCTLVAAAGNSGREERFYPAALDGVIAVGSVDGVGRRSGFGTYGDHLALSAPGEDVINVGRRGYRFSSGTSHAAPFVAGAAALLHARARRAGHELSPAEARTLLVGAAVPVAGMQAHEIGSGVLDVAAALAALDSHLQGRS